MLRPSRDGRVLRLTLARAERRNALSVDLARRLLDEIRRGDNDRGVGAILIDAEGPAFCAGMDLDEALTTDAAPLGQLHAELFRVGLDVKTPIVAAVHGVALGGGLGLVANAHIAIAADSAQFGLTELRIGMWPFLVWRSVASAIGERRTIELALTARLFTARDALAWGLVHHLVQPHELPAKGLELARTVAAASPETVARGFDAIAHPDRRSSLRAEQLASPDFREGIAALREDRPPRWPSGHD